MSSAPFYQGILDALYSAIEDLDATAYSQHSSDGWSRARFAEPEHQATGHLETWIDIGRRIQWDRSVAIHDAAAVTMFRYLPDDDALCQAQLHAAARHLFELLRVWSHPSGARTAPTSTEISLINGEWLQLATYFQLLIPEA